MATYTWTTDASGLWGAPGNWSAGGPPGSTDTALITATGTNYTVTINNGISFAVATATVNSANASVDVDGTLSATGSLVATNGLLAALNGGTVQATGGFAAGNSAASSGTLETDGNNSLLTSGSGINVGVLGTGLLEALNGGSITLTGTNGITVGGSSTGNGTILISGTDSSSGASALLSFGSTAKGITVGNAGDGTIDVDSGGTIELTGTGGLIIGSLSGAVGTVSVTGPNALINIGSTAGSLVVGQGSSLTNTLSISAGGTVTDNGTGQIIIAQSSGSNGDITVTGSNSALSSAHGITVGSGGNGTLDVANGAEYTNGGSFAFAVGFSAGSSGSVIVDGGTLTATTSGFFVGGTNASGSLLVENSGSLVTGSATNFADINATVTGGGTPNATATVTAATWTSNGSIIVGDTGVGSLTINAGGLVDDGTMALRIGNQSGGSGTVTVGGSGAELEGGTLDIAQSGATGVLNINSLGSVSIAGLDLDSGSATVNMAGGTLTTTGTSPSSNSGNIAGFGSLVTSLNNLGTVTANGGTLVLTGSVGGTGSIDIDGGATMEVGATIVPTQSVTFATSTSAEALQLDQLLSATQSFGLSNWQPGDELIINNGSSVTGAHWLGSGTLQVTTSTTTYDFTNVTVAASASPNFTTVGNAVELLCFARNTRIATPSGEVPVQQLAVGDTVLTLDGTAEPVVWIGIGRVIVTPGRRSAASPVIVRKGALADNVPHRDLRVTKGHSLYLDDALIPVEFLVNHRSIMWDDRAREIEVYHIELPKHAVLIADGAPAESYRDDGNRWLFQNANPGWTLPPQPPCAPILTGGPTVDAAWRRLLDRTGPRKGVPLTDDADLHLLINGERLDPSRRDAQIQIFELPAPRATVRIVSRAAVPQELGLARDARCLGVALRRIELRQGTRFRNIEMTDASLTKGFHQFEPDNRMRWTDGDAVLPVDLFAGFNGAIKVVLHLGSATQYLAEGEVSRAA